MRSFRPRRARLLLGGAMLGFAALMVWTAGAFASDTDSPAPAAGGRASSSGPRYVFAQIRQAEQVLIAGESGYLDIDLSLPDPAGDGVGPLRWDRDAPSPVLWVSSLPHSGVVFDDQRPPDKPGHHIACHRTLEELHQSESHGQEILHGYDVVLQLDRILAVPPNEVTTRQADQPAAPSGIRHYRPDRALNGHVAIRALPFQLIAFKHFPDANRFPGQR